MPREFTNSWGIFLQCDDTIILFCSTLNSRLSKEISMKRYFSVLVLALLTVSLLTAAKPVPATTFTVLQALPETMTVGEEYTVIVQVDSKQEFQSVQARPSFFYPGKGVVAVQAGDRAGAGTAATLQVTFKAKSPTDRMTDGVAPVYLFVGARYSGGAVAVEQFTFNVRVP
jgi:hypothetical protein